MTTVQLPNPMMEYHRQSAGYSRQVPAGRAPYYPQAPPASTSTHSRSRTTSSNVFPSMAPAATYTYKSGASPSPSNNKFDPTRRLSSATSSTSSTGNAGYTNKMPTNIRRGPSTSSRSSSSPTSYVALMRKQKATVWCDRSQPQDPRTTAAQKAAKHRATLEVSGIRNGPGSTRTSTTGSGSMVGKIRHHGVPKAPGYTPANMTGAGVPLRLSANEIGNLDDEGDGSSARLHARTGSGRSSQGSARFPSGYQRPQHGRFSTSSTPPSAGSINEEPDEPSETPVPVSKKEYFYDRTETGGSGGSEGLEREDSFGDIKEMQGPNSALTAAEKAKKAEDLRRRGSVDERTMTMSGVRLYVANPDLND
ncbi:MAG: hypothetical protein Q9227_008317 [Pyrenula ochraceoflavens]